jgi:hypothetical protein
VVLDLIRVGQSNRGTFGALRYVDIPFALTLEKPWQNNEQHKSCIPAGIYECQRVRSPKFGWTFEVTGVPNRSHILFHRGNTVYDTEGCILIGEEFSGTWDKPMIVGSDRGYLEFMRLMDGAQAFMLRVIDPPPPPAVQVEV